MTTRYVSIDRNASPLYPPDLRDWVPENHLVHFVIDAVELLEAGAVRANGRNAEGEPYSSRMLLGLLIYSYATGMFSSRQIERASYENAAVRLLCGHTHPDRDVLAAFRRQNEGLLGVCFAQVLELAAGCGVRKVGRIVVAIDGIRILANAAKPSAATYEHAAQAMHPVEAEVARLLRKADEADATTRHDGLTIPMELRLRHERKAQLARSRAEMAARAFARFQAELAGQAENTPTVVEREEHARFTELEKRLIKAGSAEHFELPAHLRGAGDSDRR